MGVEHPEHCPICFGGNLRLSKQHSHRETEHATAVGELVYIDIKVVDNPSRKGFLYDLGIVDSFSSKSWIYHMHSKTEVVAKLLEWRAELRKDGYEVKHIRGDNDANFVAKQWTSFSSLTLHILFTCLSLLLIIIIRLPESNLVCGAQQNP